MEENSMNKKLLFERAANTAFLNSTCIKVGVGCLFLSDSGMEYTTCNMSDDFNCKEHGYCFKARESGIYESCEETRHLCKAKHSEIRMIEFLEDNDIDISRGTIFVTRYPCITCTKALCKAGVKKVCYCGIQEISNEVKEEFMKHNVIVEWSKELDYEFK